MAFNLVVDFNVNDDDAVVVDFNASANDNDSNKINSNTSISNT